MSAAHALLSPSAAYRWMVCPGSVRLTEGRDDGGSVYAREGTAAHILAQYCLDRGLDAEEYRGSHIDSLAGEFCDVDCMGADGETVFEVTEEMAEAVQVYLATVRPYTALEDHLIEAKLTTPIAGCWGTLDFGAYDPAVRRLTVIDFKYGKGVIVEARGNVQLLTYAAGLLSMCGETDVDEIELVVVQPRRLHADGPVRQSIHTLEELRNHVAEARRAAALIERQPPILRVGDHCKFCRATTFCPAFLNITPNDRAPERSQVQIHRGNETETSMSRFKDQLIDNANKSTAVAKTGDNPWLAYGEAAGARTVTGDLLKFSKGDFVAGQNNREIKVGTRFIANMDSLEVGWMKWEDSRPVEVRMGPVADGFKPARRSELGDDDRALWAADENGHPRDPWQFANNLVLAAESDAEQFTFATSSKGGIGAIGELCKAYGQEMHEHPDKWPVIALEVGSYAHSNKAYGRIKFPVFELVGWSPKDGEAPAPAAPKPAPKPAARPPATARF